MKWRQQYYLSGVVVTFQLDNEMMPVIESFEPCLAHSFNTHFIISCNIIYT